MDDLYAGWTLTGAVARLSAGVLRPLADGVPGAYHPYDWAAGGSIPTRCRWPPPGAGRRGLRQRPRAPDAWTTLRVWVEAPQPLRLARGLARDGAALEGHWRRWQRTEAAAFAAEDTRAPGRAAVDGAGPGDGTDFCAAS